jgi:hypothetical protein
MSIFGCVCLFVYLMYLNVYRYMSIKYIYWHVCLFVCPSLSTHLSTWRSVCLSIIFSTSVYLTKLYRRWTGTLRVNGKEGGQGTPGAQRRRLSPKNSASLRELWKDWLRAETPGRTLLAAYVLKKTTDEKNRLRFLEGAKADDVDIYLFNRTKT